MAQVRSPLRSQRLRLVNHQGDALRLGMNWTEEDLARPQVLVDSADGMGHPGTFHFRALIQEVSNGVYEAGGKPGVFTVSDICDGVVQATEGMSYSLVSRDIMAAMVEIHALGHPHDGMVLISGNDKSVPAHLVAMARCDLPAIHLPGGTQLNAPDYVTSDKMWTMGAEVERGDLPREDLETAQRGACPTCGACQFMGSASTAPEPGAGRLATRSTACATACWGSCPSGRSPRPSPAGPPGSACASSPMTPTCPTRISPRGAPRRRRSASCLSRRTTW